MASIRKQIRRNSVALISLVIALGSLGYNTWRNETTEEQRNQRHAAFRVLESLGALQEVVDHRYYYLPFENAGISEGQSRLKGFGNVAMVRDLTHLMPEPAPMAGLELYAAWNERFPYLDDLDPQGRHTEQASEAEHEMTAAINRTREAVVNVLKSLE